MKIGYSTRAICALGFYLVFMIAVLMGSAYIASVLGASQSFISALAIVEMLVLIYLPLAFHTYLDRVMEKDENDRP